MKEVLTKSFWQGVKKTFYEAMEERQPQESATQTPSEAATPPAAQEKPSATLPAGSSQIKATNP